MKSEKIFLFYTTDHFMFIIMIKGDSHLDKWLSGLKQTNELRYIYYN
jgi:hypothetical protein